MQKDINWNKILSFLLFLFLLIISLKVVGLNVNERQGDIEYADCREKIMLNNWSIEKYVSFFTCTKDAKKNDICVSIKVEGGKCVRAYWYYKNNDVDVSNEDLFR